MDIHTSQLKLKEIFNLRMGRAWEKFEGGALEEEREGCDIILFQLKSLKINKNCGM